MNECRIFLNKKDLVKMLEIVENFPEYNEKNFEIEYYSCGIGYTIDVIVKSEINGVAGDFKIPIADSGDW